MPPRSLKVFLCHAHADRDPVRGLYSRLTQDGVDAWLDKAKLLPGQDWELEIRKAVREADVVVVCLSKQFNQAGFRQKEVRLALDTAMEKPEGEIFIIPARLEECDNLESLRRWHWVDLFEDDGYERLMGALLSRAGRIGAALQISSNANKLLGRPDEEEIERKNAEKAEQEHKRKLAKLLKENDRRLEAAKRKHKWEMFFMNIRFKFLPILFALIAIGAFAFMMFYLQKIMPALTIDINPTSQPSQILTETFVPTKAVTVSPPLTEPSASVATSVPTEITEAQGVLMVLVPAGEFTMGDDSFVYSSPAHQVYLDAFWIDQTEVTNAMYKLCVEVGSCTQPSNASHYEDPSYADHPVVYISRDDAVAYCSWVERRLPTEAEWEKAARGTDARDYPWGNEAPNAELLNYGGNVGDTTPVGTYPKGASIYGALDMAGNVWEWVNDFYGATYYQNSPSSNPQGPNSSDYRVIRGASWYDDGFSPKSWNRLDQSHKSVFAYLGFRCARSDAQ